MIKYLKGQLPPALAPYREVIQETIVSYVEIIPKPDQNTTWWQSKIGGFPYLPKEVEYPKTPEGNYLFLLAQINFSEVPKLENFPQQGILQFYIADDDLYGMNFEKLNQQDGFRLIYFPEIDFQFKNLTTNFDFLPKTDGLPIADNFCAFLQFNRKAAPITVYDGRFEAIFSQYFVNLDKQAYYDFCEVYEEYYTEYYSASGHRIGGYPNFTQSDPRDQNPDYDILLLQLDSVIDRERDLEIRWGDDGVGNFFIKELALKHLDFSDVIYNYDCY